MNFPTTRYTLIHRLATSSAEEDWTLFLADYWRPLCRFAVRWGRLDLSDAEDVAAITLEAVIRNDLLARWALDRRARLRTLLCSVVRRILANEARREMRQQRRIQEFVAAFGAELDDVEASRDQVSADEADAFYRAWAEEILQAAVESLLEDYHREGRGNYFRVFYGRVCENLPVRTIAESLSLKLTDVDNYFRHARSRLESRLKDLVRWQVLRYSAASEVPAEFEHEWSRLGEFLKRNGGLEASLRASYADFNVEDVREREAKSLTAILESVRSHLEDQQSSAVAGAPLDPGTKNSENVVPASKGNQ
ncbi:MAG: RNA polymerase sigma factor [Planctomycetota bacterium]|jgi:RNA polymerase sigma factor (sigma-70 family)